MIEIDWKAMCDDRDKIISTLDSEIASLRMYKEATVNQESERERQIAVLTQRVKELEKHGLIAVEKMELAADAIEKLEAENAKYNAALEKISSGIGRDILGTTSLTREDMQEIASGVLKEADNG